MGEVEDAKSIDDLVISASKAEKPMPDFENLDFLDCKRTQDNPNRELQKASHLFRRKSSIREAITYGPTNCLYDLRLLQS